MKIEEIDPNLKINDDVARADLCWHDVRKEPEFCIYGLSMPRDAGTPFHRIPFDVATATSEGVKVLNLHTAGGRIRFSTDSPYLALLCEMAEPESMMVHMPLAGSQGFDLYTVAEDGTSAFCRAFFPSLTLGATSFQRIAQLPAGKHDYTLNFPLYGTVKNLYLGLAEGAYLGAGKPYVNEKPAVFYGSSSTQGGCASRPGNSYEAHLSHKYNLDYINLGFSGAGKAEPAMVEYLASIDTDLFVSDYDHNSNSPAYLAETLPVLYRTVRAAHPDALFVFASSPGVSNGEERRAIVRKTYEDAVRSGDRNVRFVDGKDMFDGEFSDTCTLEGCHPNDLGFYRMFRAFEAPIREYVNK